MHLDLGSGCNCVNVAALTYIDMFTCWTLLLCCVFVLFPTVPGRVRVAVRLRPRNAEELVADADFADCVELQSEVLLMSF